MSWVYRFDERALKELRRFGKGLKADLAVKDAELLVLVLAVALLFAFRFILNFRRRQRLASMPTPCSAPPRLFHLHPSAF